VSTLSPNIDLFDNDERIFINGTSEGEKLSDFTRAKMLGHLDFTLNISTDDMVIELSKGLKSKISKLTDTEWYELILRLPFPVTYGDDDEEDVESA